MEKLAKLSLLAVMGFCFLGVTFSRHSDLIGNIPIGYNIEEEISSEIVYPECLCAESLLSNMFHLFLIGIGIISCIMLVILFVTSVSLYKKFINTERTALLFYIPILNLYPLSKMTIGRIRFFLLLLFLGFLGYLIYKGFNTCCVHYQYRQIFSGIIVGLCSVILLGVLLSKLPYLIDFPEKDSNKEPSKD